MNTKVEASSSPLDSFKLLVAVVVVIGGIVGFYYLEDQPTILRVLSVIVAVLLAVGIAVTTQIGKATWQFFGDARMEVRKVVWPTRQETLQTTLIVLLMVILAGLGLWVFDWLFLNGFQLITGQGG